MRRSESLAGSAADHEASGMSAEIVNLSDRRVVDGGNDGNGALLVVGDYLRRVHAARVMARSILGPDVEFEGLDMLPDPDHFLAWLWDQGFKIEPL